jgi:hypothetical protein
MQQQQQINKAIIHNELYNTNNNIFSKNQNENLIQSQASSQHNKTRLKKFK